MGAHRRVTEEDLHVTEAELIRLGIDRGLDRMARVRQDPGGWSEAERYILARMRKGTVKGKRRWTREDLYDR